MFRTTMCSFHLRSGKHPTARLACRMDVETKAQRSEVAEPGRGGFSW